MRLSRLPGVQAVVTSRAGGVSTGPYATLNLGLHVGDDPALVVENRRRAAALIGATLDDLVFMRQTHGRNVAVVDDAARGRGGQDSIDDTDALVTSTPGLVLVVMVADCVPMVLFDPAERVLAVVHAGWKGTALRIVDAALEAMNSKPAGVRAFIGPAISGERYQVGPDVASQFDADADVLVPDGPDHWRLDLRAANRGILIEAGLVPEHIEVHPASTGGDYFSDRAERPCGRFGVLARLTDHVEGRTA